MKKQDKKLDNSIIKALTQACDKALEEYPGFCWLTHRVNYNQFPQSLKIICVFENNLQVNELLKSSDYKPFIQNIVSHLNQLDIKFKKAESHIFFDNEEDCSREHNGNWQIRLSTSHSS